MADYSPRWGRYFRHMVEVVASNSPCLRRQVGAVIVKDKRIIATGYNGVPSGFRHCSRCDRGKSGHDLHICPAVHAEVNALLQCARHGLSCDGVDMFVSCTPCNDCLKAIIQAGIGRVYVLDYYQLDDKGERVRAYLIEEAHRVSGFEMTLVNGGMDAEN